MEEKHNRPMAAEEAEMERGDMVETAQAEAPRQMLARRVAALKEQEAAVKAVYPDFSLQREAEDPLFVKLVQGGVDMRAAYEFVHRDELTGALIREVAAAAHARALREKDAGRGAKEAERREARQEARPAENGTGGRAPVLTRPRKPSEWSRAERERVGREALRGRKQRIQF